MNQSVLALVAMVNSAPKTNTSSTSTSTSNFGKFGAVLAQTMDGNLHSSSTVQQGSVLPEEAAIMDLVDLLNIERISELEDGLEVGGKLMMEEDFTEEDALMQLLLGLQGANEDIESFFQSILALLPSFSDGADLLSKLKAGNAESLHSLLQQLNASDLQQLDVIGTVNLLKLVKIHQLLLANKDLTQEEAQLAKEMKQLLQTVTTKMEQGLKDEAQRPQQALVATTNSATQTLFNKTNDVLKTAYSRISEAEENVNLISNGLNLKTSESNGQNANLPFQMTKIEQLMLNVSNNGKTVNQQQFINEFEGVLRRANITNANGTQKILIRLNPEHLGALRIELIKKDGLITAKLLASTAQAKGLLEQQLQGLKQAFANQNIQVEKIEISQQMTMYNLEKFAARDEKQNEQGQQKENKENDETSESEFTDSLNEALLNIEV